MYNLRLHYIVLYFIFSFVELNRILLYIIVLYLIASSFIISSFFFLKLYHFTPHPNFNLTYPPHPPQIISYATLLSELDIDSVRVLEDLIIETIYAVRIYVDK